jgi:cobalt-zinc-cadmium efflux system outer membrane protein
VLAASGCSVPKEAGWPDVERHVEPRTGHRIYWNRGGVADREVERVVRAMLARSLSPAEAVQIALLNNRELQATYEELMISQADLVQAGLLHNPVFGAAMRWDVESGTGPHPSLSVEQDFLSLLLLPARKRVAGARFEAVKLRVAHEVVSLAYDVRATYFTYQGALQVASMRRAVLEAAEVSVDLALRLREAGNISELDLVNEQSLYDELQIELARSEAEALEARERLTRLMGLWGPDAAWRIEGRLPDLPAADPPVDHIEAIAITWRLDLASALQEAQARSHELAMARDWRWLGGADVGAELESGPDGVDVGPSASIELPLFDQHQAVIARLEAEVRQAEARARSLAVSIRSEVREATARMRFARGTVEHFKATVIPRRERLVTLTQQQYDAMLVGAFELIQAKQREVEAYREYIEAARDYWIARSDLDRAAGGRLVKGPGVAAPPAQRPAQPAPSHVGH